jgi:hypothetical protein
MRERQLVHDLRTPLAAMRNTLDAMRLRPHDPQTAQWAHALMERQVAEMTRLLEEFLEKKEARL